MGISIEPVDIQFPLGVDIEVKAIGSYSSGDKIDITYLANWTSFDCTIVCVNDDNPGVLESHSTGNTFVSVSFQGESAMASVEVTSDLVDAVYLIIEPKSSILFMGEILVVKGQVRDESGNFHDVPSYLWQLNIDDESIVSIDNNSIFQRVSAPLLSILV